MNIEEFRKIYADWQQSGATIIIQINILVFSVKYANFAPSILQLQNIIR